jgi:hypothetical protein
VQPSKGKSAAEDYSARYQADLADMSTTPSQGFKYFLFLVNVFSREAWAAPLRSKEPAAVAPALVELLEALPEKPQVLSTDTGLEFAGRVTDALSRLGVAHKTHVGQRDVNALGVLDRAMQNVKARMARTMARQGAGGEWAEALQPAVAGYNKSYHSTIHESPEELLESKEALFMVYQDNARKLEHNQKLTDRRVAKLREAGAFRRPLGGARQFKRGFRATYGPVEVPTAVEGSTVRAAGQEPVDIKLVQVVDKDSSRAAPQFAEGGDAPRREAKRAALRDVAAALQRALQEHFGRATMRTALQSAQQALGARYASLLKEARVQSLADVVRLFPERFELQEGGRLAQERRSG